MPLSQDDSANLSLRHYTLISQYQIFISERSTRFDVRRDLAASDYDAFCWLISQPDHPFPASVLEPCEPQTDAEFAAWCEWSTQFDGKGMSDSEYDAFCERVEFERDFGEPWPA